MKAIIYGGTYKDGRTKCSYSIVDISPEEASAPVKLLQFEKHIGLVVDQINLNLISRAAENQRKAETDAA